MDGPATYDTRNLTADPNKVKKVPGARKANNGPLKGSISRSTGMSPSEALEEAKARKAIRKGSMEIYKRFGKATAQGWKAVATQEDIDTANTWVEDLKQEVESGVFAVSKMATRYDMDIPGQEA